MIGTLIRPEATLTKVLAPITNAKKDKAQFSTGKKGKKKKEEIPSPITVQPLCNTGRMFSECGEELPDIALFISLRSTVRTAGNRRGSLQVAPIFDPAAVTPLDMWALTGSLSSQSALQEA